jgi:hypothetical protein
MKTRCFRVALPIHELHDQCEKHEYCDDYHPQIANKLALVKMPLHRSESHECSRYHIHEKFIIEIVHQLPAIVWALSSGFSIEILNFD